MGIKNNLQKKKRKFYKKNTKLKKYNKNCKSVNFLQRNMNISFAKYY